MSHAAKEPQSHTQKPSKGTLAAVPQSLESTPKGGSYTQTKQLLILQLPLLPAAGSRGGGQLLLWAGGQTETAGPFLSDLEAQMCAWNPHPLREGSSGQRRKSVRS